MALAVVDAHERERVAPTLEHFPGLGRTGEDTHHVRPTVPASLAELREPDLVPFRLLLDRAPAVMVSHAALPQLGDGDRPASCSRAIVEGLLRRELGFHGVAVTDDLEMGAVTAWPPGRRAIEALKLQSGELAPDRVLEASCRVGELRHRYA